MDEGASIHARAGYGGANENVIKARVKSGTLFGERLHLSAGFELARHSRTRFFGIGNGDEVLPAPMSEAALIDARFDDTSVATRYSHEDLEVGIEADARLTDELFLRTSMGYRHREFVGEVTTRGDAHLEDVYDTSNLVGYDSGLDSLYIEAAVAYDARREAHSYHRLPSSGYRLDAWVGYRHGLADDPSRFVRFGGEAQRYFDLWGGNRVLMLRARFEGVSGELDNIPFVDLPTLGGSNLLRGYTEGRFRDRYSGILTAEYRYPIQDFATGFVFAEAGRVWRNFDELDLSDNRLGFGGGLQFHTASTLLGRLTVASSIDGGVQFGISFDPIFGSRNKAGRKN